MIYLDNQASTPVALEVINAMLPYYTSLCGNAHSTGHSRGGALSKTVANSREVIAGVLDVLPEELLFVSGATEANNLAIQGLIKGLAGGARDTVLVGATEHACVLETLAALAAQGLCRVKVIDVDNEGFVDKDALESALTERVLLVCLMAVNNEIGTIQPLKSISEFVKSKGALLHIDMAQAPYGAKLNEITPFADSASFSGHKMYAPQGIGVLYERFDLHDRLSPLIYGGMQQGRLRSGTLPVAMIVALGAAFELLDKTYECVNQQLRTRAELLFSLIAARVPNVTMNGPPGLARHPGNLSLSLDVPAIELMNALYEDIAFSIASACKSESGGGSHVLNAIGLGADRSRSTFRLGISRYTTEAEIKRSVDFISHAYERLKL